MAKDYKYRSNQSFPRFYERVKCKALCNKYNSISPDMVGARIAMLKKILGATKSIFLFEQPFMCDYGYNIKVGDGFYSNHNLVILDTAEVIFGDNVLVGPNCSFYTSIHPLDAQMRGKGLESALPITVGNNVWIGGSVTVLPGVTIGDNSVIGAGSVVKKDIPANVLAVGNPCEVVKLI